MGGRCFHYSTHSREGVIAYTYHPLWVAGCVAVRRFCLLGCCAAVEMRGCEVVVRAWRWGYCAAVVVRGCEVVVRA